MIMRCGRQGWSPRRPNLICHNPSVTAIVSRVRVLLAHQGMLGPARTEPARSCPSRSRAPIRTTSQPSSTVRASRSRRTHSNAAVGPVRGERHLPGLIRLYNTRAEVDGLAQALIKAQGFFS